MRYVATEDVPLDELDQYPGNPRVSDMDALRASVRRFGQYRAILARAPGPGRPRRVILAGNHTALAMAAEGHATARVEVVECESDDEAARINAADNRLPELGRYDEAHLAALLESFAGDYGGTGWTDADLDVLKQRAGPPPNADDLPDPSDRRPVITQPGDLWKLGGHRLLCGDCRDPGVLEALMGGEPANLAFTSPPYADRREYDEASPFRPVPPDEYVDWFEPVAANVKRVLASDGSWFVNIKAGVAPAGLDTELYVLDLVLAHVRAWGWHFATEFCWERAGVPKAVTRRFKNQFEPVYQFTLGSWRTFPGAVAISGRATAGRFGYAFEPIYQFTPGEWKMRPEAVRHPSDDVPIPGGPGTGDTGWQDAQGGNAPLFGAARRGGGSFGAKGFHIDQHQGEGNAGRAAHEADWERRSAAGEIRPTKRKHGRTGAMSDAQGTPAQPGEFIAPGLAYPGNRLPTFAGSHTATGHTAAFPVGLPAWFIRAYTDRGDTVLDPFAGSGSTLMAAHLENRRGYACEISPLYCDLIVRRFETFTGMLAERVPAAEATA